MKSPAGAQGVYGAKVTGLDRCAGLGVVPSGWPEWRVVIEVDQGKGDDRPEVAGTEDAFLRFGDGSTAEVHRTNGGGSVRLRLATDVPHAEIAHPYLAVVGMFNAYWGDGIALHAGAVGIDGTAWLILTSKAGGKSTTLALLEMAGHPVLADDLSIIDSALNVHRGPRFVDLREEAAESLGVGEYVGVLGVRERWRYRIADAPLTLPLGGIVVPTWGEPTVDHVVGSARLEPLAASVALRVPAGWDELLLTVASSVPMLRWSRPHDLADADRAIARLEEIVRTT